MKIWVSSGLLALLPLTLQAGTWSNLWQRPDQQGEKALESGDPKNGSDCPRRHSNPSICIRSR